MDDGYRLSDELWGQIEPPLPLRPSHPLGCHNPPKPARQVMDAILFVLRTGCQWDALNATGICSSSVERTHSWLNRFRRILIRWDKKPQNYLALLLFAGAIITGRQSLPG